MAADADNALFHVDRFSVAYAGASPLKELSLTLNRGDITCILGKSGCGKTTLLKALGGFAVGHTQGTITFQGKTLQGPNPDSVMIFQENNLFPWLTVRRNVEFGLRFSGNVLSRRERQLRIEAMLGTVGLLDAAHRYPFQLSGGMRQRTAIARALVSNPRVVLLDEPFSALDISLRRRMQLFLKQLGEERRISMVMVTHNVEEAITLGHRVIVLGGQPARILLERETRAGAFGDRYSTVFLDLQREIESIID
ncbi:ABC transporter ATP-binding protein [Sodalis sp. RH22]|uniref:ABC transporter ATP-binding protein n=1 Tax=unclassified Sodalis (in: enterobacteria) TaxID=2636512 RepID=UPI0039B6A260